MKKSKDILTTVRLTTDDDQILKALSDATGKSQAEVIRILIRRARINQLLQFPAVQVPKQTEQPTGELVDLIESKPGAPPLQSLLNNGVFSLPALPPELETEHGVFSLPALPPELETEQRVNNLIAAAAAIAQELNRLVEEQQQKRNL